MALFLHFVSLLFASFCFFHRSPVLPASITDLDEGSPASSPILSAPGRPHPERAGIDTHIVIPREKYVKGEKTLGKLGLDGRTNIQTASSSAARRICRPPSLPLQGCLVCVCIREASS
ncbi:hypothetical protein FVEG_17019 [Fusarium verticillioides 7600]|uniref:Uncharacterized protein n=1 Tax=Gibberella moniliformis (strain M3125 / FGSC 7600) TaxID=334819 RepID=W7MY86_GIBM7|nr:hypothetical protein FVEG_17019 [Fusarium verticillioides 7600]EWG52799.1 hypothetical protein FVEG_17019 [Fusarium verticillioides 7600]